MVPVLLVADGTPMCILTRTFSDDLALELLPPPLPAAGPKLQPRPSASHTSSSSSEQPTRRPHRKLSSLCTTKG
ncbi:Os07g0421150 [Oryza sativa Japonica Group]|uniref:Os07g0421150 protein n=1 Tax=Oryza sativa subsp. japonica TaxID=39947 RepID=A0A0P0X515_ORYSJ|nr:hypothetical protein DAI22_07g117300 [Oryza sativa Japonica Group]BAT01188.1 Os07g0421150 [Oryza sativa Japonica Group]